MSHPPKLTINELNERLGRVPVMAKMHPLSVAFLSQKSLIVFPSTQQLIDSLDEFGDNLSVTQYPYLLTLDWQPHYASRLLAVEIDHDPLTPDLNNILSDQWDWVCSSLLKQSDISEYIVNHSSHQDCIILVLIDGLSWSDFRQYCPMGLDIQPVIVDGISNTKNGMSRIVGQPTLIHQLVVDQAYGFSYWERNNNTLTNSLFDGFGGNVKKIRSFNEILTDLQALELRSTYVQIIRQGLDGICHQHRDCPDPQSYVKKLYSDCQALVDLVERKQISAQIYLTSDHGILWQNSADFQMFDFGKKNYHPRYLDHQHSSQKVKCFSENGSLFSALVYPYVARKLKSNEWGVHGGLSFEESIVPLVKISINQE
jgi:hypothetical protein